MSGSVLEALFGPGFAFATAVPMLVTDQLFPDERRYIARAVEKRQAEFGTARLCARRALAQLGVTPCSLVPYPDRAPRWPDGIIGSISHTDGCCAVAVTDTMDLAGLGLDLERDEPLPPELEPMICTAAERNWLNAQDPGAREWLGKLFFSAKEAFYKCQYRTTRTLIDFLDVELELDLGRNTFSIASVARSGAPWDRVCRINGTFQRAPGLIVAGAMLSATLSASSSLASSRLATTVGR